MEKICVLGVNMSIDRTSRYPKSYEDGINLIGVGVVITDDKDFFMAAMAKTLVGNFDADVAELLALSERVLLARNLGIKVHSAKVDASNMVSAVIGNSQNFREAS
ncbi:hypothetical protein Q3G72_032704 [Acer saccharum]|nr:hypothetical protein Q3G72_032704 [Acer saccharum]